MIPDSGVQIWHQLLHLFIILLLLLRVSLFIVSMYLFEEVVEVSFKPFACVIGRVSSDVEPSLCIHIHVFLLISHIKVDLKNLVGLNQVNGPFSISLHAAQNLRLVGNLSQYQDDVLDWVLRLLLMLELGSVTSDFLHDNDHNTHQSKHSQSFNNLTHHVEDK